ncbi:DUF1707 domain-containing protein [Actinomadura sp. DC4]|uniref:DUF1707 SHOCT-like domain-containing protein n=1 Tax=Actinomadura sp. DC4 TaxID=3055069 RepID=UPI0025B03815|nr:DUF1707 domain-containing protein [Actinomadura sp. DC4]MDN3354866.1 DUF1707 domain-containing protein [Actinomadura sp. DC4]
MAPDDPLSPIGEPDRDAAVRRLQEAYAEGHLSHEEMDSRLDQVLTAKTHGEVATALASLPAEKAGTTSTVAAISGRIRRSGAWRVPRTFTVESALGKVRLDLSRAIIEHPVVDIELRLGTGGATITVPRDAIVDFEGLGTVFKAPRYKPRPRSGPGGPTIRISGAMGMGRLKIRHARR